MNDSVISAATAPRRPPLPLRAEPRRLGRQLADPVAALTRPPRGRLALLCVLFALSVLSWPARGAAQSTDDTANGTQAAPRIELRDSAAQDRAIQRRLAQIYAQIDGLETLQVQVRAGVVELDGEVPDARSREQALRLAQQVQGVVEVADNTHVARAVAQRLSPALHRLHERAADFVAFLPLFGVAVLVVVLAWGVAGLVARSESLYRRFTSNALLRDLLRHLVRLVIVLLGVILAAEIIDATALISTIFGAAGVVGLALGFALKDTVENYLAGILLSLRQPFTHDDRVLIAGYEGAVVRLTLRATILMSLDGNHVRIPNATVLNGVVVNFTRNPQRRFEFDVGVGTAEDLGHARQLAVRTLQAMDGVLDVPLPMCSVEALGDFNVLLRVYGWMDQHAHDFQKVRSEAIRQVKEAFDAAGVTMPEPTQKLRLQRAAGVPAAPTLLRAHPPAAVDIARRTEIDKEVADDREQAGQSDLLRAGAPLE